MRILLVATDVQVPGSHGGSTHVGELMAGLSKRADTLLLARSDSTGEAVVPLGQPLRHANKPLRHVDAARLFPRAYQLAKRFGPDVIYERCSSYGLGAMLSLATSAPLLTMVLDERYSWLSLLRAETLVATELSLIPRQVRHKAVAVHWGANVDHFAAGLDAALSRRALGLRADAFVVGYAGSFKSWHGLEGLVQVATILKPRGAHFLMIGDGPCRLEIERAVRQRGLTECFSFLGQIPYEDVPRSLAAADVCVAPFDPDKHRPSRELGSFVLDPLKVFEYLAMQKPTVTIRAENLLRIFRDREHLLLYEPNDQAALAQALLWVLEHPEEAARMANKGRELVLAEYTWQAHADHLHALFERMSRRPARSKRAG